MRARGVICQALSVFICLVSASSRLQTQTRANASATTSGQASSTRPISAPGNRSFTLADLPLQFEENVGQADARARFLARGRGYTLLLNRDGLALNLAGPSGTDSKGVYMRLLGARAGEISGREQTATRTNYYIGPDPSSWHQNVRSYRSVAYTSVYQGIDLIYHGNGNQLEYDFVLSPGADPGQVRMRFDGLNPRLDGKDISFDNENHISVRALKAFQTIGGEMKSVDATWQIQGDQASIHLGPYDHSQPLTIDPVFFYGSYVGGSAEDSAVSIVPASQAGYYFVALSTNSAIIEEPGQAPNNPKCAKGCPVDTLILGINATDAPAPSTPFPPYSQTAAPLPVLAINSATYIGSTTGTTSPTAMTGDSNSNLYVTGTTNQGGSFTSLGPQVCSTTCTGFASKLSTSINTAEGSATLTLQYSFALPVIPAAIAVDSTGDAYLTGSASSAPTSVNLSVPPGDVAFQKLTALGTALTAGTHAFLLELDPTGIPFFASYIGGSGTDQGNAIAVSGQTVFVAGQTSSADFPRTVGNTFGGTQDGFVLAAQNLATTPALLYSTYLGGAGTNSAASIAAGAAGTVVVAGSTNSGSFPIQSNPQFLAQTWPLGTGSDGNGGQFDTPPTTPPTTVALPTAVPEGNQDAFVTSLAANGSLTFTDFLGGSGAATSTAAQAVALDNLGVVYVTGSSTATGGNQPFLSGTATEDLRVGQSDGLSNIFFAQIDPSGKYLLEATLAGSSGTDTAAGLTVSSPLASSGIVSIVGSTTPVATEGSATPDFFQSASLSLLNPNSPTAPTKDLSTDATGFFVEEALAGYCNMQLTKQVGKVLSFSGPCVSGTQSGTLFATASTPDSESITTLTPVPITVAVSGGVLTGTATLNLGSLTGTQSLSLSFGFLPVGAVGGTGTCSLTGGGTGVSGCGIVTTGGGGGGTIFSVTSGTLSVNLTCTTNCSYLQRANTVLAGQTATLNASIVSGSPNSVTWTPVNSPTGQLTNTTATTANFVSGTRGGTTKITATATADGTTTGAITLTTLEVPTIHATLSNAGTPSYGQAVSIAVSSSGNSATPSGAFTYVVDDGNAIAGTLSASGAATLSLTGLSAGSHSITVSYPGNYQSGGFLTPASSTLNFSVNQASLTVQATNANVQFGKPIPTLTYTITGFQYTDTAASLGGAPVETTTATASSPIGPYPITITQGTLGQDSAVAANYSFTFVGGTLTIVSLGAAPAPVIAPAAGTYTAPQTITISDSVAGAKIYYTLDGSTPSPTSTLYTGPFTLRTSATVQAIATATGYGNSGLGSATYTINAPALSAATLSFGSIIEGLTSTAQAVTLTNQGLNPLTNVAISIGGADAGDFSLNSAGTCGATLAAGASCSISVLFTPAAVGSRNAALSVNYTGIGSPLSATLQGTGLSPISITSTVTQLTAGSTYQFSANQPVTWTASAGTIDSTGLFTAPNPPPSPDVVTITAISVANSQLVATIQVTIALVPTITLPSTNTLSPGQSITIPFSLAPGTGIPGDSYKLACTPATLPADVTCVFNPNPIVDSPGSNSGTLTITSNALNSKLLEHRRPGSSLPLGGSVLTVACCFLFGIRRRIKGLHKSRQWMLGLILLASGALLSMSACGTGGSFKTGSSTAYVTGSFAIQATVTGATAGAPDYNQTVSIFTVNLTIQ